MGANLSCHSLFVKGGADGVWVGFRGRRHSRFRRFHRCFHMHNRFYGHRFYGRRFRRCFHGCYNRFYRHNRFNLLR
jgi:hypothetical protein